MELFHLLTAMQKSCMYHIRAIVFSGTSSIGCGRMLCKTNGKLSLPTYAGKQEGLPGHCCQSHQRKNCRSWKFMMPSHVKPASRVSGMLGQTYCCQRHWWGRLADVGLRSLHVIRIHEVRTGDLPDSRIDNEFYSCDPLRALPSTLSTWRILSSRSHFRSFNCLPRSAAVKVSDPSTFFI
jgi:hypothetical protein